MKLISSSFKALLLLYLIFNILSCGSKITANKNDHFKIEKKKQNILFIAIDDLRPMLNSYGNSQIITPNLDKLAAEGVQFNNAYCNVAVCGASRATIMTGIRPSATRFVSYYTRADKEVAEAVSLHGIFKKNGYKTISYGKIFHNAKDFKNDWSEIDDTHTQFDYQSKEALKLIKNKPDRKRGPAFEYTEVSDETYSDGKTTNKAIQKLKELKKTEEPFFLAVGYVSPHLPFIQPTKYGELYKDKDLVMADNPFKPKNAPKQAVHNSSELRNMYMGIPKEGLLPTKLSKDLVRGYYASVSYTDVLVGKLIKQLDDLGLRDNTTIILWGDHGFFLGEHGMWTKHSTLNEAIHVPLIVSSPGMKKNVKTTAMTEYIDIYPSLCEIAGIEIPKYLTGTSFVPVLKDPNLEVKSEIYTRYRKGEAVVDHNYSYTEFVNKKGEPTNAFMLFDIKNDKKQNVDISKQPRNAKTVEKYREKLKAMRKQVNKNPIENIVK